MNYRYIIIGRSDGVVKQSGYLEDYDLTSDYIDETKSNIVVKEDINFSVDDWVIIRSELENGGVLSPKNVIYFGIVSGYEMETHEVTIIEVRNTFNDEARIQNYTNLDTYNNWENALFQQVTGMSIHPSFKRIEYGQVQANKYTQTTSPAFQRWDYSKDGTELIVVKSIDFINSFFYRYGIGMYFDSVQQTLQPDGTMVNKVMMAFENRLTSTSKYPVIKMKNNVDDVFMDFNFTDKNTSTDSKNAIEIRSFQGTPVYYFRNEDGKITNNQNDPKIHWPASWYVAIRESYNDPVPSDASIASDKLTLSKYNHVITFKTPIDNRFLNGASGTIWDNINIGQRWDITDGNTTYQTVLTGVEVKSSDADNVYLTFGNSRNTIKNMLKL